MLAALLVGGCERRRFEAAVARDTADAYLGFLAGHDGSRFSAETRLRLENHKKALENYEFIKDELLRLSTKIAGLAELSVNRQDPDFITSEVDSVAASVQTSEQAMSELEFLTGFGAADEPTPALLDSPAEEAEDK